MNPYTYTTSHPEKRRLVKSSISTTENGKLWTLLNGKDNFDLSVSYLGVCADSDWQADEWRVKLSNNKHSFFFSYKTGFGHRYLKKGGSPASIITGRSKFRNNLYKTGYCPLNAPCGDILKVPNLADILHCLLMERTHGETFADWCSNFGYDEDSRKATDIYLTCQEQENSFYKLFDSSTIEQIEAILEDY